jgi:hypothetical protein
VLFPHTDIRCGDCPYLDACRHLKTCRCVHYELDKEDVNKPFIPPIIPSQPLVRLERKAEEMAQRNREKEISNPVNKRSRWVIENHLFCQ